MVFNKRSIIIITISSVLLGLVIFTALYLGAGGEGGREYRLAYNLTEIAQYKTAFVGDNSKVIAIASRLPAPDSYFKQQFISMKTSEKPYSLTVYYEAESDREYEGAWPIGTMDSAMEANSRKNALVLFSMIGNLDEVTFAYRKSKSRKLDTSQYDSAFTFQRASFEDIYGDLSGLGVNLDLLADALAQEISAQERQRMDLYVAVIKATFRGGNEGNNFVAVELGTLEGLSDHAKEEVLKDLTSLSADVYSFEDVKNDKTKFRYENGQLKNAIGGTSLYLSVEEYSEHKAILWGTSWSSGTGAVFTQYEATYENGVWELKVIGYAVS